MQASWTQKSNKEYPGSQIGCAFVGHSAWGSFVTFGGSDSGIKILV